MKPQNNETIWYVSLNLIWYFRIHPGKPNLDISGVQKNGK